jgi:hypothetical protein
MMTIADYKVSEKISVSIVDVGIGSPVATVYLDGMYIDELYLDDPDKDILVFLEVLSSATPEYYSVYEAVEQICERLENEE